MRTVFLASLAALLILSGMPMANAAGYATTYGAKVLSSSTDFNPLYQATPAVPTICSRDTGVAATASDDLYYIHNINTGVPATVAAGDVRLTSQAGFSAGTIVVSEADVTQTFGGLACTAFEANVGYIEADGLPGYTAGDEVVWSADATLGAGDIRLSPASGSGESITTTAGTYVAGTDTDVVAAGNANGLTPDSTTVVAKTSFALRFYDANLNTLLDTGDTLYLAYLPAGSPAPASPTVNDIYLYAGSSFGSFGAKVTSSSTDHLPELDLCGGGITCSLVTTTSPISTCGTLLIHFANNLGTTTEVIQVNDIVLYAPSTTTCASPQPSSAVAAGTRVTTAAQLQGTAIFATTPLAAQIYFVDANSNGYYDANDPVYIHRAAVLGGTGAAPPAAGVTAGDFRVTAVTAGASSYSAGTVVASADADAGAAFSAIATNVGAGTWFARRQNVDGATETPLTTASTIKFADLTPGAGCVAPSTTCFTLGTDAVYVDSDSSGTVTAGDIRLNAGNTGLAAGPTTVVLAGDADAVAVRAIAVPSIAFRVTGGDATFENGRGESVYYSADAFVNGLDLRVAVASDSALTVAAVACPANADCTDQGLHSGDRFFLGRCVASCNGRLVHKDVQLAPTTGTRLASTGSADFVPTLQALPTAGGILLRYNRGDPGAVIDDTFYASGGSTTAISVSAVRLSPMVSLAAGTIVATGDTEELSPGAAVTTDNPTTLASRIASCNLDSAAGYTLGDAVYVDNPLGGTVGALSNNDIRLTSVTVAGQSYTAGTLVLLGNQDLQQAACATWTAGAWTTAYFDENGNGAYDVGDVMYALPPSSLSQTQPTLGAVYLTGSGGSTSSGSTGGGSSTPVVTPPVTTTTATATATSTTTATNTTTSTSTATSTTTAAPSLDALNLALHAGTTVTRDADGNNIVRWPAQPGVMGYQVWSHDSPWALVLTVDASTTSLMQKAPASTHYLVTAYLSEATQLTDINTQAVPGLGVNPSGPASDGSSATADSSKTKGTIPGPGLLVGLGAVAAALALARRRLA